MLDKMSAKTYFTCPALLVPVSVILLVIFFAAYAPRAASELPPDIVIPVPQAPMFPAERILSRTRTLRTGKKSLSKVGMLTKQGIRSPKGKGETEVAA